MPVVTPDTVRTETSAEPPHPVLGRYGALLYSDSGGLTQFGAFVETLAPGARSSLCHWHAVEDEFVYLLSGEVVVHEGGTETTMQPGSAACFRAGAPAGHFLENRSDAPCSYLVVGTRAPRDTVTYPDHDRILVSDRVAGTRHYTTLDGRPADNPYDRT